MRTVGVHLREETIRHRTERGALLDAETGFRVGGMISGTADRLEAGPLLRAMHPDRRYVIVHIHPEGHSFSPPDVTFVAAHWPILCVVAAVGLQGTWYVMSVIPDWEAPSPAAVVAAFRQEEDAVAPQYREVVQSGALTRREAQRQLSHEVWERIASALGLRYDRV